MMIMKQITTNSDHMYYLMITVMLIKKPSKLTNNRVRKQRIPDVEQGEVSSESLLSVKTTSQTVGILIIILTQDQ